MIKKDKEDNSLKFETKTIDKNVVSTHNVIPAGRQPTKEDIDEFVDRIKKERKDKGA